MIFKILWILLQIWAGLLARFPKIRPSERFFKWEKQHSKGKNSKSTRPLLEKFLAAEFWSYLTEVFSKNSDIQEDFKRAGFPKIKFKKLAEDHMVSPQV